MNQEPVRKLPGKPRILVAPLDWGLGHATRCIPLIRELLLQEADVWLAGEGALRELLTAEFPQLPFLELPGYRITYSKTGRGLAWKMVLQVSKLKKAIQFENRWLKKAVADHQFDAIISDNRFGLYHAAIPCIYITHQLIIKSSVGKWSERILQKRNYKYINRFTECWIPDTEGEHNLAGELSHPVRKPHIPVKYIGWLSRFSQSAIVEKKDHLLIVLSGPEPQRSLFEEKIIGDISHYDNTATIVRGLPGTLSLIPSTNMIRFYNHLSADDLNKEMMKAELVISRSGYSTIMDIFTLQKRSVLVPTPGQTEQKYLGVQLMKKNMALTIEQDVFDLAKALKTASHFSYTLPAPKENNTLHATVKQFFNSLY